MRSAIAALVSVIFAVPVLADSFSQSDLRPYIRAHGWVRFQELPPGGEVFIDRDWTITQGGAVLSVEARSDRSRDFRNFFARGVGSRAETSALKTTLNQNRVGQQTSCEIDNGDPLPHSQIEITWYGKNGRRNSFLVVSGPGGASGLPPCGSSVIPIVGAINDFVSSVRNNPGTERLSSP